jgi:hypothetical protein
VATITKIEVDRSTKNNNSKGEFQYNLYKDKGRSGKFEVTLFKNSKDDSVNTNGILLHSKLISGRFIEDDH